MFTYTNLIAALSPLPILLPFASSKHREDLADLCTYLIPTLGFSWGCLPRFVHRAGFLL